MERPRFDAQREREFITQGWWRDDTLPRWLARHAAQRPDQSAVAFPGGALTWQALQQRVLKAAQGLKTRGVAHGDVVAVQLPLDSHPKIMQSAIVPMPDPVLGERVCVFVTLKTPSEKITLDELVDYLVVIPEMPLTPTRKIIKGRLRLP